MEHSERSKEISSRQEASKQTKVEVKQRHLRTCKVILCHDYCMDVLARIFCDSIKLQLLYETDSLRKRAYLLQKDC